MVAILFPVKEQYMTLDEAAAELGLKSASSLRHAIVRGILQTERRGWMHFVTPEQLEAYRQHVKDTQGGKGKKRPRRPAGEGE